MYSLFIGRWAPFHDGHKKLIDTVLKEGKKVLIAVRDTKLSEDNPYTVEERIEMIRRVYGDDDRVKVIAIPDISEVCYGRDVGWSVREIRLDPETEAISATELRRGKEATKRVRGFTVWLTGLPSSGKSTVADAVAERLAKVRARVERLDADEIRRTFWPELGYSKEDRDRNIIRAARLAAMLTRNGVVVVASFISPYRDIRRRAREIIGDFVEVYVKCPLEVCMSRDARGMYKKAVRGEIQGFTGVSDPYEEPENPEVVVQTNTESVDQCADRVMNKLREIGYI